MRILQSNEYSWTVEKEFTEATLFSRWHISKDAYQVLEVIMRQALIDSNIAGYSLGFEERDTTLSLANTLNVEKYVANVLAYIDTFEDQKRLRFEQTKELVVHLNTLIEARQDRKLYLNDLIEKMPKSTAWILQHEIMKPNRRDSGGSFLVPPILLDYGFERAFFEVGHFNSFLTIKFQVDF